MLQVSEQTNLCLREFFQIWGNLVLMKWGNENVIWIKVYAWKPHVQVPRTKIKFLITRGSIQKFPNWPPGARTANGTAVCHLVLLYRYFVSQSSEFCRHNPLCCFSTSVYCCCSFRYRLSPETFGYSLVFRHQRHLCSHPASSIG
jgi:hypothetical protein